MRSLMFANPLMDLVRSCLHGTDAVGMIELRVQALRIPRLYARSPLHATAHVCRWAASDAKPRCLA